MFAGVKKGGRGREGGVREREKRTRKNNRGMHSRISFTFRRRYRSRVQGGSWSLKARHGSADARELLIV